MSRWVRTHSWALAPAPVGSAYAASWRAKSAHSSNEEQRHCCAFSSHSRIASARAISASTSGSLRWGKSTCCAFIDFELSDAADAIVLTLEAPAGAGPAMHMLADLFATAKSELAT
jgi:hypothetical protein